MGSVFPRMSQNSFVSEDALEAEDKAREPPTTTADQVNKPAQVVADVTETDEQPQEKRAAVDAECDTLNARKAPRVEQLAMRLVRIEDEEVAQRGIRCARCESIRVR